MDQRFIRKPDKEGRIFRLGDRVRILSGAFAAFTGQIEGINQARGLLKVKVGVYGRYRRIKLKFADAEKISFA